MKLETSLEVLAPQFKPLAVSLIAEIAARGIKVRVINTLRTEVQQAHFLALGTSWRKRSKHQDGLAIDLCPEEYLALKNWNPAGEHWPVMGEIGKELGLVWGGDWHRPDCPHFEMPGGGSAHA